MKYTAVSVLLMWAIFWIVVLDGRESFTRTLNPTVTGVVVDTTASRQRMCVAGVMGGVALQVAPLSQEYATSSPPYTVPEIRPV